MLREIKEQPAVLAALAKRGQLLLEKDGGGLFGFDDPEGASFQRILFLSCGSSYHASLAGKWMVETFAGLCCQVEYAHEYRLSPPLPLENCLVVGLSQSGETLDTLEAMRKAKQAGARILSICNVANSTAISLAHTAFLLEAGPEKAVASTKVVSAQLAAVFLLALRLGIAHGRLPQEFVQKHVQNLMDIPNQLSTVLQNDSFSKEVALALHEAKQLLIVGKGLAYAIALEGALKLKETCYLHAEAFAGGEFRHGPMALVEPTVPTLLLMPSLPQESFELMQGTAREIRERAGPLWVLTQKRPETLGEADAQLYFLPQADAFLSTFLFLAPLQTLAYHLAHGRGLNVDSPRGLCKAVVADP